MANYICKHHPNVAKTMYIFRGRKQSTQTMNGKTPAHVVKTRTKAAQAANVAELET